MNSPTNVTPSKFRRTAMIAALAMSAFLAMQSGNAQTVAATLTASNNAAGPFNSSSISITGNQQFFLRLQISTNFISSGITFFLQSSNNASGFFRITSRDMSMSPYPDPTTSDATAFGGNAGLLDPVNDFDLGGTNNGSDTDPAGMYTIATFTLSAMNLQPGQYTIFVDRGVVTDRTGGGFEDRPFTAMATIIVPEPATVCFAVIGGLLLVGARWRSKR
jgi:hypothetical protein